jgi:ankyrin repeat protein
MYFVWERNVNEIRDLLKRGVNIDYKSGGRTALLVAADDGDFDIVKLLLHAGAKCYTPSGVSLRKMVGNHKALSNALANLFIESSIDTVGISDPVGVAIILLVYGADPNARNSRGETPLMSATSYLFNHVLLETLLSHGANVNARDNDGKSVLEYACGTDVISALLAKGADPNVADPDGRRPLNGAASTGDTGVLELLLKYKAAPNVHMNMPEDHSTPLTEAINCKYYTCVKELIKYGANVNYSADGYTPIMYAVTVNDAVILRLLLKHGADVNAVTPAGFTLLQLNMVNDPGNKYGIRAELIGAGERR